MSNLNQISEMMQRGRAKDVKTLVAQALEEGVSASAILQEGLIAGMSLIGEKFKNDEIFIPEVLLAARAMNSGLEVLKPYMETGEITSKGTIVIGTVLGDLHDIGKNLVAMMLKGKGFDVIDLGVDVPTEKFIEAAKENNAKIICCSALLTTTMEEMSNVIKAVHEVNLNVKIMVGGAPVTEAFAKKIGADCYTADATSAAEAACNLIS